jgi:aerobic C4-dicarboxylate transport protein
MRDDCAFIAFNAATIGVLKSQKSTHRRKQEMAGIAALADKNDIETTDPAMSSGKTPWYFGLTMQVFVAAVIGIALGHYFPQVGEAMQPLGDTFIKLIRMVVAPIAFLTIVSGVATVGDLKRVGKIGGSAILYFEIVTTAALALGLIVADVVKPGAGLGHAAAAAVDVRQYQDAAAGNSVVHFLTNLVPDNVVGAFARGDLLQIVLFGVLFGCAGTLVGAKAEPLLNVIHSTSTIMFRLINMVMRLAPIGAFGAMAFSVGKYGIGSVVILGKVLACVYATSIIFVVAVLFVVARASGFSLYRLLSFAGAEILIVVGTAASESVLPQLIAKLNRLGCSLPAASLVLPTGYSFNADGASIYLSIAALFIAQAYGIDMTLGQQIGLLVLLMLTSKGASGVGGAGFITLAATLSATHVLPVEGLGLLIGVDRFMTQARATTNIIGNIVGTVVVSRLAGEFDDAQAGQVYADYFGPGTRFNLRRSAQTA